jgi:hypothetical protein
VFGRNANESRRATRLLHSPNGGVGVGDELPLPGEAALDLIDRACGARPGDRGPAIGDPSVRTRRRPPGSRG